MLASRGREGTADLAVQRAPHPQAAGLVQKTSHLRGHAAESCRRADDDGIVVGEILDRRDRRTLFEFEVGRLGGLQGRGFRNALQVDRRARLACALGHRAGHGLDVPIGGVIKNENFGHEISGGALRQHSIGNEALPD
jgi:hypothetical protein